MEITGAPPVPVSVCLAVYLSVCSDEADIKSDKKSVRP